jgi:hypothetical protein
VVPQDQLQLLSLGKISGDGAFLFLPKKGETDMITLTKRWRKAKETSCNTFNTASRSAVLFCTGSVGVIRKN